MPNFWTTELEARRAGRRPHFRGDDESREAYAARMAPITAAQEAEAQDFADFQAQRAAERAAAAEQAAQVAAAQAAAQQAAAEQAAAQQAGGTPGA